MLKKSDFHSPNLHYIATLWKFSFLSITKNSFWYFICIMLVHSILVNVSAFVQKNRERNAVTGSSTYKNLKNHGVGHIERFFFKNRIKNPHLFFIGDRLWNRKNRVIARHAFPARGLKNGGATRFVKKKKHSK